jgi:hypothetical protein
VGKVLSELVVLALLILFLFTFPRLLIRTWATGRYGGFGSTLKPKVRSGPSLIVSAILAGGRIARYIAERLLGPAIAAGSRTLINTAAQRRHPHDSDQPWAAQWRRWRNYRSSRRSDPMSTEPTFIDYTPDNFDTWDRP